MDYRRCSYSLDYWRWQPVAETFLKIGENPHYHSCPDSVLVGGSLSAVSAVFHKETGLLFWVFMVC